MVSESANVIRLDPDIQRHVRARIARLPAVAHAFHEQGQKVLSEYLVDYFDALDDALFELADSAECNQEQNMYFDSMREVRVQRKGMEHRFFEIVEEAFARLVGDDSRDLLKDNGELSAEALSLVQNEDLEQLVALEDVIDRANKRFPSLLHDFNQALASIISRDVTSKKNPFGPSVIALAGMAQFKRLDVDVKAKSLLFCLFDELVVQQLPNLFQQLFGVLSLHGFVFTQTSVLQPDENTVTNETNGELETKTTTSEELVSLLSFVQKLPSSTEATQSVDIARVLASVQGRKGETLQLGHIESETIHLVQMLFQFVLDNDSLDPHMKSLFCRLQVPFAKLALLDETFLTRQRHPARLLINELASVALQWSSGVASDVTPKDPMYTLMKRTVDRIVFHFDNNVDIFKETLADFSAFVEKEARRAAVLEKRTIDAEAGKAKAEQARAAVASEVELQLQNHTIPDAVLKLINGPWSNVLFVVGLKYGFSSREWLDQVKVLSDLIWSVQPCGEQKAREHLILLIPGLVANLRLGLDSISYNPFEVSEVFRELEEIHLLRMRGESLPGERSVEALPKQEQVKPLVASEPMFDADDILGEIETLMSDMPSEPTLKGDVETTQSASEECSAVSASVPMNTLQADEMETFDALPKVLSEHDPHMLTVAGFAQGAWFGFSGDVLDNDHLESGSQELLRCRLAAIIKQTGKYIFVNRSGMKVAEKTQQELAESLRDGHLRPLDSSMLFDKALESVVTGLRKSAAATTLPNLGDRGNR